MAEKKWYCTDHLNYPVNAGSKAARDAAQIAKQNGAEIIPFYAPKECENRYAALFYAATTGVINWMRLARRIKKGEWALLQHPHGYRRVAAYFIDRLKARGVHFAILLHDLNDRRFNDAFSEDNFDNIVIDKCEKIICLNDQMAELLCEHGFDRQKLYSMQIWDYLHECEIREKRENDNTIIIAGNLHPEKSAFVYQLDKINLTFNLYGMNYNNPAQGDNVIYHGKFAPEELIKELCGAFGLVWDGNSIDVCEGSLGRYLKYNSPHKCSLYLSAGIPVIVWKEAAVAKFVEENGVGICVGSLHELEGAMKSVTDEQYKQMRTNAARIGEKMRKDEKRRVSYAHIPADGTYIKHCIKQCAACAAQPFM